MISGGVVVNDAVKLKAFEALGAIDPMITVPDINTGLKNYHRLDLGLCVFCAPENCEVKFQRYKEHEKSFGRQLDAALEFSNIGQINVIVPLAPVASSTETTVDVS
jgi:hypothetical protein